MDGRHRRHRRGPPSRVAAFCFLVIVPIVGDSIGRLLAAAILGLTAGLTTVLVEVVRRKAWLVVHWSEKEKSALLLGASPILVGSASQSHILLPDQDYAPVAARISLAEGVIRLEDGRSDQSRVLRDGETLTFGRIRLEVRASGIGAPQVEKAADPPKPRKAKEAPRPAAAGITINRSALYNNQRVTRSVALSRHCRQPGGGV